MNKLNIIISLVLLVTIGSTIVGVLWKLEGEYIGTAGSIFLVTLIWGTLGFYLREYSNNVNFVIAKNKTLSRDFDTLTEQHKELKEMYKIKSETIGHLEECIQDLCSLDKNK